MTRIALGSDSTNVTTSAPRLNASMPTAPVPAYKSKKRLPDTRGPRMENKASRTLSDVGRREFPCGALRRRPRWEPAMTRIKFTTLFHHSRSLAYDHDTACASDAACSSDRKSVV